MKKMCLICGTVDETDALTCPADGEASWQPVAEEPAPEQTEPEAKPKKKKAVAE